MPNDARVCPSVCEHIICIHSAVLVQLCMIVFSQRGLCSMGLLLFPEVAKHGKVEGMMAVPFENMVKNGVVGIMRKACALVAKDGNTQAQVASSVSPDAWLRPIVFHAFVESVKLAEANSGAHSDLVKLMHNDIKSTLQECSKLQADLGVESVLDDLRHLATLLAASADPVGVVASELSSALHHVETIRLRVVSEALSAGDFGKAILASAKVLLQESSKDAIGDENMALAMRVLEDHRLPTLNASSTESVNDAEVVNFHMLSNMAVVDTLNESVCNVEEALDMWSRSHTERMCPSINEWLEKIGSTTFFYDECLVTLLQALTAEGKFGDALRASRGTTLEPEVLLKQEVDSFGELVALLETHSIDETSLLEFYDRMLGFIANLPSFLNGRLNTAKLVKTLENLKHNLSVRSRLQEAMDAITLFGESSSLQSPREILDEWKAKKARNDEASTYIARGLDVVRLFKGLEGVNFILHGDDTELKISLKGPEGCKNLVGSFRFARSLPHDMCKLTLPAIVGERIFGCMQTVIDDFGTSLFLPSLSVDPLAKCLGEMDVVAWINSFSDQASLADAAKSIGKYFSNSSKEYSWPCVGNFSLMQSLMEAIPDENFKVHLEVFCKTVGGGGRTLVTSKASVLALGRILMAISQIAITLNFLKAYVAGDDSNVTLCRDGKLKEEVDRAALFLKTTCSRIRAQLEGGHKDICAHEAFANVPLMLPIGILPTWLSRATMAIQLLLRCIVLVVGGQLLSLSEEVDRLTPSWKDTITDKTLHVMLAKRGVLQSKGRASLNQKLLLLNWSMSDFARVHTSFGLTPKIEHDDMLKGPMENAKSAFSKAKAAVEIIAILSVLWERKGDEQQNDARNLLDKMGETMPAVLKKELEKVVK